ncbi:M28 family metallopeptidase [Sphingomonas sp. BIUV-7]|uniref:M28 family metallopeptidase n=1 Tax=Sphingomonas natans TaxID=3063330 RepID=A0ABT8YF96_9SPHN|nr:M28 family metallopeptidase [Sphingomonas sp. BIUV-7]MDO6416384.1 M28 family metallopeptidase [Sphingomonas sp. BIUV-7]
MRRTLALAASLLAATAGVSATRGEQWWAHVQVLAADDMKGRITGSPDHLRAADYVIGKLKALGLEPAGVNGFLQPVAFTEQRILGAETKASLEGPDGSVPIGVPDAMIVSGGGGAAREAIDAPLVFAGYGLRIPEAKHDDFAGLDVKGKIVVVIAGGPSTISGALKSNARSERTRYLAEKGALGIIALTPPKQIEIPWPRRMLVASQPAMFLADPALRDIKTPFFSAMFDTAKSELLFKGSGHRFEEVAALADASKPVAGFDLAQRLKVKVAAQRRDVMSANVVARMPGSDPALRSENVVVSAHLDGLGVGEPIKGDTIYNGAMDDASGVATVLEIAAKLKAEGAKPKRSILFLFVTAEEKGLLGSRYFASRPTVPAKSIVADLNFDMPLPLWPLETVLVLGAEESSLGEVAKAVSVAQGLPLVPDPLPDRNSFTRSDQFSFIRQGIPAVAFKFGFARGTPQEAIEKEWRAVRYHSPSDDVDQPVEKEEAVKLNDFVAEMALRVANGPARPTWNADSAFKKFVRP